MNYAQLYLVDLCANSLSDISIGWENFPTVLLVRCGSILWNSLTTPLLHSTYHLLWYNHLTCHIKQLPRFQNVKPITALHLWHLTETSLLTNLLWCLSTLISMTLIWITIFLHIKIWHMRWHPGKIALASGAISLPFSVSSTTSLMSGTPFPP